METNITIKPKRTDRDKYKNAALRPCRNCGKEYRGRPHVLSCCLQCDTEFKAKEHNERTEKAYRNCVICHVAIGLTCKQSALILSRSAQFVKMKRKAWSIAPSSNLLCRYAKSKIVTIQDRNNGYWGALKSDWSNMALEYKPSFPDWSKLWTVTEYSRVRYRKMTPEQKRHRQLLQRKNNAETRARSNKRWRERNRDRYKNIQSQYAKKWRQKPKNRIALNLRKRINEAIKGNYTKKTDSSMNLVGCSWEFLRQHIERQFQKWMTWENYGKRWHIDHIVPCAKFDLTKPEEQRACFHYSNLRPLEAMTNITEGDRRGTPQQCTFLHLIA